MAGLTLHNPEQSGAAPASDEGLEGLRQQVDAAFEDKPDVSEIQPELTGPPSEAVPVTAEGQVVDSAQRQRIEDAQQAVDAAYETTSRPASSRFEDLLPG